MSTIGITRRLEPMPSSTAELAADIATLLKRGRVAVALAQLEKLPGLVRDEITDRLGAANWQGYVRGFERGFAEGRRALAREITHGKRAAAAKPKRPPSPQRPRAPRRHEWLAQRIRDPKLRERAKAALRLSAELLDAIAAGGVGLGSSSWRKLREALAR
jgi:hypothetical protein